MKNRNIVLIYKSFYHSEEVPFIENLLDHVIEILLRNENDRIFLICDNDLLSFAQIKEKRFTLIRKSNKLENFLWAIEKFKIDTGIILNFEEEVLNFAKKIVETSKIKIINDININSFLEEFEKISKIQKINENTDWKTIKNKKDLITFQKKNDFFPIEIEKDGITKKIENNNEFESFALNLDKKVNIKIRNNTDELKWYVSSIAVDVDSNFEINSEALLLKNALKINNESSNILIFNKFTQLKKEYEKLKKIIKLFLKGYQISSATFTLEYSFFNGKTFIRNFNFGITPRSIISSKFPTKEMLYKMTMIASGSSFENLTKDNFKTNLTDLNFILIERKENQSLLFCDTSIVGSFEQLKTYLKAKNIEDQITKIEEDLRLKKIINLPEETSENLKEYQDYFIFDRFAKEHQIKKSNKSGHLAIRNTDLSTENFALLFKLNLQENINKNIIGFTPYLSDILNLTNYNLKTIEYRLLSTKNIEEIKNLFEIETCHFIGDHKNNLVKNIFDYAKKKKQIKDSVLMEDIEHLDQIVNYNIDKELFNIQLIYVLIRKDINLEAIGRKISNGFILNIEDSLDFDLIRTERKTRSSFKGIFPKTQNIEIKYHYDNELKTNNIEINNSESISIIENISKEIDILNNVVVFVKKDKKWTHYKARTIQRAYIEYMSDHLDLKAFKEVIFEIDEANINQYVPCIKDLAENNIKVFLESNEQIEKINSTLIKKLELFVKNDLTINKNSAVITHGKKIENCNSAFIIEGNNFETYLFVESLLLARKDWIKHQKIEEDK